MGKRDCLRERERDMANYYLYIDCTYYNTTNIHNNIYLLYSGKVTPL